MKTLDIHRALFAHNDWARDKLLDLARGLSDGALDQPAEMGPGSLRATLRHLWGAERVWLERWKGEPGPPGPTEELSVDQLGEQFRETASQRDEFLDSLGQDGYGREVTYTNPGRRTCTHRLGDLMLHVCNHGMHHRAQALNMLRRAGVEVPGLDYLFMKIEPSPPPVPEFDIAVLQRYFRYCDWAWGRVLVAASGLSDEQLDRPFDMGVETLRKTLLHIRDAEQWWLENWSTDDRRDFPEQSATTPMTEIGRLYEESAQGRDAMLARAGAAELREPVSAWVTEDRMATFALGETMLQLCSHGTHHRAQALNMLRRLGADTPALDYQVWLEQSA
jgi:uncharacterized damage-inducible protein DinB